MNVAVLGSPHVGKTSLITRYRNNSFSDSFITTVDVDICQKNVNDHTVQIWDTAGQERFRSSTNLAKRRAQGCMLVFALNDADSLNALDRFYDSDLHVPWVCVGNKSDCSNVVTGGRRWAVERGMPYVEVSAKTGKGVVTAFESLIAKLEPVSVPPLQLDTQRHHHYYYSVEQCMSC